MWGDKGTEGKTNNRREDRDETQQSQCLDTKQRKRERGRGVGRKKKKKKKTKRQKYQCRTETDENKRGIDVQHARIKNTKLCGERYIAENKRGDVRNKMRGKQQKEELIFWGVYRLARLVTFAAMFRTDSRFVDHLVV